MHDGACLPMNMMRRPVAKAAGKVGVKNLQDMD